MSKKIRINEGEMCHLCHSSDVDGYLTHVYGRSEREIKLCSYCYNTFGLDSPKGLDDIIEHINRMMNVLEKRLTDVIVENSSKRPSLFPFSGPR